MRNRYMRCWIWLVLVAGAWTFLAGCSTKPPDFGQAYLDARAKLLQAAEDPKPQVRTNALEALAATLGEEAGGLIVQSLQDEYAPVRFSAAMAAGDSLYAPAKPALVELAQDPGTPPKLMCAVVYALHRMGDQSYTTELGRLLLRHPDKWVRATAAMVMGRLGEESAAPLLRSLYDNEREVVVRLQVAESLGLLHDERYIGLLEGFTKTKYFEDRLTAIRGLGNLNYPRSMRVLAELLDNDQQDPIIRAAAAHGLAKLGDDSGYGFALKAATEPEKVLTRARGDEVEVRPDEVVKLKTMAILALGHMGRTDAIKQLHPMVFSEDGSVRVAACRAILQLLEDRRPPVTRPEPPPAPPLVRPEKPLPPLPLPEPPTQPATRPAVPPVGLPATQPAPTTGPAGSGGDR